MYQLKTNIQDTFLLVADFICITLSLITANFIRHGTFVTMPNQNVGIPLLWGMCICVFLIVNLLFKFNSGFYQRGSFHELMVIIYNNIIILVGVTLILYFTRLSALSSRLMLVYFMGIDSVLMLIVHQLVKKFLPVIYKNFFEMSRVLLVADSRMANKVFNDMTSFGDFSRDFIGVVITDKRHKKQFQGIPIVSDVNHLIEYCQNASLDEIMVAVSDDYREEITPIIQEIAQMGVTIHYFIQLPDLAGARHKMLTRVGKMYTVTYANQVASVWLLKIKRAMDVLGGLVGCLFAGILFVIFGPIIKLQSPGPILFSQKRVGRNGRIFNMYKFRSMYVDAEERKKELMEQNEMEGFMFKMENDPRITPIGRFMRKTSLDEFPQFYNILKGDMSLVGTRPPTVDEFSNYSPYHKKRLSFRPGLTGMWQVSGRNNISDFEEIVRLDVEYIDSWSLLLDVKILLKTVIVAFSGR